MEGPVLTSTHDDCHEDGPLIKTDCIVVEYFLELFVVAQKQMVVKCFDHEDLLQLQRTEVMA